ncbi:MAG: Holliday junction ATP-dependent DNA helicase RuvA [Chlamydiae bacterium]|nr:Holliday junction ATP-dependent DNA helicase RuvA [Chlamydiota bacterium]
MYEYIKGVIAETSGQIAVIEASGVGYRIHIPVSASPKLPEIGKEGLLFVSWVVREMSQTLFGFLTREERDLFELLITLSGIGPKTALALLGQITPFELQEVVFSSRVTELAKVPGIGKKTAERLLVDLKGKLHFSEIVSSGPQFSSKEQDALQALLNLGIPRVSAQKAIKLAKETLNEDTNLAELLNFALRHA